MEPKVCVLTSLRFGQQFPRFETEVGSLQSHILKSLFTVSSSDFGDQKLSEDIMIDLVSEMDPFKNCFE